MQRAHHLFFRHKTVIEHELSGWRSAHPDLVDFLADGETLHALLDQKGRNTPRFSFGCGFCIDDQSVCIRRVGDPIFGTVEDIAALNRFGL